LIAGLVVGIAGSALAGGGGENAVVIIDPSVPQSLYVGHYYAHARRIPACNVLYVPPAAANFAAFLDFQRDALLGTLETRGTDDHIDYVVVTPGGPYYVEARGLVNDGCSSVTAFSVSSVYTFSFIGETIGPNTPVTRINHYYSPSEAAAFDSSYRWKNGRTSTAPDAERYFVAGMLGYDGERGNTVDEIIALVDRSVAADGTRPDGTFYYVQTTDCARSCPRHARYPAAVQALMNLGAQAEHIDCAQGGCNERTVIADGRHDILGLMTGWASPDIAGADITILPGAMCDHLTSFAATFRTGSQTKLSRWIAKGAVGSFGTIEEPCNYPGKFPHPWFHVFYYQGMTLGEAGLRSLQMLPWQVLTYGDPLAQPFAYLPRVRVPDAPQGEVFGTIPLTPEGETDHPDADISGFELYVDGRLLDTVGRRGAFELDTTALADGHHDLRVVAFDDSRVRAQHHFVAAMTTNNFGLSAGLDVAPRTGDRSTIFQLDVSAAGAEVDAIWVVQSDRVVASSPSSPASIRVHADSLGAGPFDLQAVAQFANGRRAYSEPIAVEITYGPDPEPEPDSEPPVAFGYARDAIAGTPILLELPGTDVDDPNLTYQITRAPAQGALSGSGPVRLLKPDRDASGSDEIGIKVVSAGVESAEATIRITYHPAVPCDDVRKLKAKCRRGTLKVNLVMTGADHDGDVVTVSVNDEPHELTVKGKKAKLKLTDRPPGSYTVKLTSPADCKPPVEAEC